MSTERQTNTLTSWLTLLSTKRVIKFVIFALIFSAFLIVRVELLLAHEAGETLVNFIGITADVAGVVADDPDKQATLKVESVNGVSATGNILIQLNRQVSYGDHVVVHGKIQAPENFETQAGREFDYKNYLRARGILATMSFAQLKNIQDGGWSIKKVLFSIKHSFEHALQKVLPQPEESLLEGILLGERGGFPQELMQIFVLVGLVHIVVLSGSNIAIVADAVARLLSPLPKKLATVLGLVAIVLFALMTGGGAATLRAVIMGGIAIVARYMRRPDSALRALGLAAAVMILWNPLNIFDSGFVLSILATFGLITLSVAVEKKLAFLSFVPNIQSVVATTIAVEIFILPALLYFSGVVSVFSIVVNALVLPFVSLIMLLGFITGVFALVAPALALVPAVATMLLLHRMIWIATTVAGLPLSHALVPAFPAWILVLVYIPLTLAASYLMRQTEPQRRSS